MSETLTELAFKTRHGTGWLKTISLINSDVNSDYELRLADVSLELVTGISFDGDDPVMNPDHAQQIDFLNFDGEERISDTIILPSIKAVRLLNSYMELHRGHSTDCHDFVAEVENWGQNDKDGLNCEQNVLPPDENLSPSTPYVVLSRIRKDEIESDVVRRTHSCIATEGGRLLSVMGRGSMLSLMDVDATKSFYSGGGSGYLSQAISPEFAASYPDGIVPSSDLLQLAAA